MPNIDPTQLHDEARFSDSVYARWSNKLDINPQMFRLYAEPRHRWNIREMSAIKLGPVEGKKFLDMGCGMGEESVYFAKLGALVTSIDVSPVGVEILTRRASHNGLEDRIHAFVGDVTATGLPNESFDLIHGLGILHHVGLDPGFQEVLRLLKPGGKGVFIEHMENSQAIDWIKRTFGISKEYSTEAEKPVRWADCQTYARYFTSFELYPYYLLGRLRRHFRICGRSGAFWIDHAMLTMIPALRGVAGGVLICVQK